MATLSEFNLYNLIDQCIQNVGNAPRYDPFRMNEYFRLDKDIIVNFLANNLTNVEYDTKELSNLINITDEQILEDLKQVLIRSIIVNFNGGYTNSNAYLDSYKKTYGSLYKTNPIKILKNPNPYNLNKFKFIHLQNYKNLDSHS